jgi:hypothetical protein
VRVTLNLPDDLYALYAEEAQARSTGGRKVTVEHLLLGRLQLAVTLDPTQRHLLVHAPTLERLEQKLGGGHVRSETQLADRVERLARVRFGDYEIQLTPAQYEEIAFRANKQGRTIDEMLKLTWQHLQQEFFTRVP